MAKSINKVILVGNVGQDPEVKYTASGVPVARVSLATNERFKDRNDAWQDRTEWHTVVAWQRLAEIVGEYVRKGSKLLHRRQTADIELGRQAEWRKEIPDQDCRPGHCPARLAGQRASRQRRNEQRAI
jgi:primosomal replication protein N